MLYYSRLNGEDFSSSSVLVFMQIRSYWIFFTSGDTGQAYIIIFTTIQNSYNIRIGALLVLFSKSTKRRWDFSLNDPLEELNSIIILMHNDVP